MAKTIIAICLFVVAGGIFFVYTKPAYSTAGGSQAQIAQYQGALDNAAQLDTLRQQLLAQYNAFNPSDISRLETMLPDQVDNIGLILDLDNIASRYGLALENVDVSSPDTAGASTDTTVGGSSQTYGSLTLQFSTYGTYASFEQFLTALEDSLRIVDLVSLNITQQNAVGTVGANSYRYDMTIKTYWLK